MEYVNLGSTGLRVSRICLGMMSFGDKSSRQWCASAGRGPDEMRRLEERYVPHPVLGHG